jgi:adenylate cyclase
VSYVLRLTAQGRTERHSLKNRETVIGRGAGSDVVVIDESMSRRHARLVVDGDAVTVEDLDSSNGVFKNGERVKSASVRPGDLLRFGGVEALLESPPVVEQPARTDKPALALEHTIFRRLDIAARADEHVVVDAKRVLRLMSEVGKTLVASLPLGEVLARVVELLLAHVPAERAAILLIDPATGTLVPTVSRLRTGESGAFEHPVSRTVTDLVLRERAAILSADVLGDTRFDTANSLRLSNVRSLMCGPLSTQNENIGVLLADTALAQRFSEADLELFTALAHYASTAIAQARLTTRVQEEMQRRERLARYHSPAVVDAVLSGVQTADVGAEMQERDVSVMFTDIVGFTTLAEAMTPAAVADFLNGFFSTVTDVVFAHHGTIDKFIGDAVLVVFGAPLTQDDHAARAVAAAKEIMTAIAALNARRPSMPHLRVRMAINSGPAIVGDVGSGKRLEYTVLGDVVNTCSRMESTVAKPDQIVIGRATLDRLPPGTETTALGPLQLRGRAAAVEVFALM